MPETVDRHKIGATFKNGVLTVLMPKSAEAGETTKKVEIISA